MPKTLFEFFEKEKKTYEIFEWNSTEDNIKAFVAKHKDIEHFQAYPLRGTIVNWTDDISSWKIPAEQWEKQQEQDMWDELSE